MALKVVQVYLVYDEDSNSYQGEIYKKKELAEKAIQDLYSKDDSDRHIRAFFRSFPDMTFYDGECVLCDSTKEPRIDHDIPRD
jgi:hypothetical protein